MKRIAAASLAAVTALSLAAAPAQALKGYGYDSSSKVTDVELGAYAGYAGLAEFTEEGKGVSKPYKKSSDSGVLDSSKGDNGTYLNGGLTSSGKNDANQGYPLGT
ncbi:hypothetical protein, partial [Corynebacterium sp. HMSC071B10]|uniref:hypothetical protein n=1 Tax=Corynebacterium sp. HMSC071B10 TaxID=1739494 RepID=UPI0014394054